MIINHRFAGGVRVWEWEYKVGRWGVLFLLLNTHFVSLLYCDMGFWYDSIFFFYQNYSTGVPTVAEGSTAWIRVLFPADVFVTGQARTLNYVTVFPWKPTSLVVHWVSTWKRHVVIPKRKTCHYTDKSEQQNHDFHHRLKPRSGPRKCRYLVGISCIWQRVAIFCLMVWDNVSFFVKYSYFGPWIFYQITQAY